jgi:hypothetical protein
MVASKKNGKLKILNATTMKYPYPLPFIDIILNIGWMFILF